MNDLPLRIRRTIGWAIQRNPTYLISAALTVIGARLFLVDRSNAAGDIKLILLTLGILQVYEWAVGGILIALDRAKKSPEDKPSLLLISAAFWTGPIAATLEMIALRPNLGTNLAAGICLVGLAEMRLYCRILRLELMTAAQFLGAACMILLACAGPLLKMPESASGANELYLYAIWWVFAAVVLASVTIVRKSRADHGQEGAPASWGNRAQATGFLAITILATAVHLVGMNYGFYCHAMPFYASPAIIALSAVGFETFVKDTKRKGWVLTAISLLPVIAILLAICPFDEHVPVQRIPAWLRDPLATISAIAALAWWWGYVRHRRVILLHAANASFAFAVFQINRGPIGEIHQLDSGLVLFLLYATTGYFLLMAFLRLSRIDAIFAICTNLVGTIVLVHHRMPADALIICVAAGWSVLVGIHLATRRSSIWVRLAPIAFMMIVPWTLNSAPLFERYIAAHSAGLIILLLAIGHVWRWTSYRSTAALAASGHFVFATGLYISRNAHPAAMTFVIGGFAFLVGGALVSWHKLKVLKLISAPDVIARVDDTRNC